jgi:hypothetical protein
MKIRITPLRQYEEHFTKACALFDIEYMYGGVPDCDGSYGGFDRDLDGLPYAELYKWFTAYVFVENHGQLINILLTYRRNIEDAGIVYPY